MYAYVREYMHVCALICVICAHVCMYAAHECMYAAHICTIAHMYIKAHPCLKIFLGTRLASSCRDP